MIKNLFNQKKPEFVRALAFYKSEIASIRTGRATPALVENLEVIYYDQKYRVKELASISAPEPKMVIIQPWDKNALEAIESAIRKSNLGLNPIVDGQVVRLVVPSLTEERRKEFTKLLKQKSEEARIKIRRIREEIWGRIQEMEKNREIRQDEKFRAKDDLQKITDEFNGNIAEMEEKKEKELMS